MDPMIGVSIEWRGGRWLVSDFNSGAYKLVPTGAPGSIPCHVGYNYLHTGIKEGTIIVKEKRVRP